jgi:hypothetical protein
MEMRTPSVAYHRPGAFAFLFPGKAGVVSGLLRSVAAAPVANLRAGDRPRERAAPTAWSRPTAPGGPLTGVVAHSDVDAGLAVVQMRPGTTRGRGLPGCRPIRIGEPPARPSTIWCASYWWFIGCWRPRSVSPSGSDGPTRCNGCSWPSALSGDWSRTSVGGSRHGPPGTGAACLPCLQTAARATWTARQPGSRARAEPQTGVKGQPGEASWPPR